VQRPTDITFTALTNFQHGLIGTGIAYPGRKFFLVYDASACHLPSHQTC
jgi:hypothetical protein